MYLLHPCRIDCETSLRDNHESRPCIAAGPGPTGAGGAVLQGTELQVETDVQGDREGSVGPAILQRKSVVGCSLRRASTKVRGLKCEGGTGEFWEGGSGEFWEGEW